MGGEFENCKSQIPTIPHILPGNGGGGGRQIDRCIIFNRNHIKLVLLLAIGTSSFYGQ